MSESEHARREGERAATFAVSFYELGTRLLALACASLLAVACGAPTSSPLFEDAAACLAPAELTSPSAVSLPALVDRADVIALVNVTKAERTYAGYHDRLGARRLTLRPVETVKGSTPARFVIDDGPCPMLAATEGESFVALLEPTPDGTALKPVGLRTSALRATPARSLSQLVSDIRSIHALDGEARALFERYGWKVTAKQDVAEFDLPSLSGFATAARQIRGAAPSISQPLDTYAALSTEIGLDLRVAAGKRAEELSFWLERRPPEFREDTPFGHVLIAERNIVAAWVTVMPEGGPFSVRDRSGALAAPRAHPSFPPANRFPGGVNVARTYDLASAKAISFKSDTGANGDIADPARVRAFAAALDATLATTQAVWDRSNTTTRYYLYFDLGQSSVGIQYDTKDGVLSVLADGYSVKPGPTFAALIAGIR